MTFQHEKYFYKYVISFIRQDKLFLKRVVTMNRGNIELAKGILDCISGKEKKFLVRRPVGDGDTLPCSLEENVCPMQRAGPEGSYTCRKYKPKPQVKISKADVRRIVRYRTESNSGNRVLI